MIVVRAEEARVNLGDDAELLGERDLAVGMMG